MKIRARYMDLVIEEKINGECTLVFDNFIFIMINENLKPVTGFALAVIEELGDKLVFQTLTKENLNNLKIEILSN